MIIPERIKRLMFEKIIKKAPSTYSETATFYLLISYILETFGRGLSITKVKGILSIMGIPENETIEADNYLKKTGFILKKIGGRQWYCLSPPASEFCKRRLDIENKRDLITTIIKMANDIKTSAPRWKINRYETRIGSDMAIYVDSGEAAKVFGCIKNYKSDFQQGNSNICRHAYIIHAPTAKAEFLDKVSEEIRTFSTFKPHFIEVESWDVKKFNKLLDPMINAQRKHLDILFSAMPRIAVISLYIQLNANGAKFEQNWIYNEGKKYNYGKGKTSERFEIKGSPNNNKSLVVFSENYTIRFEEMIPFGFYEYDIVHIGYGKSSITEREYTIDTKSLKTMKELQLTNSKSFAVDYLSPDNVFYELSKIQPSAIFVSGNRVVALGIAQYYLFCLINSKSMKRPMLISTHVFSNCYSEGVGSLNIPVLKL